MQVITGDGIKLAQALSLRAGLKLETLGMKRHGRPMSVIIRERIGSKTRDKKKLLVEFDQYIEETYGFKPHGSLHNLP